MIVDTSAVVAIVNREPEWAQLISAIENAPTAAMSAVSLLELNIVLGSERFGLRPDETTRLMQSLALSIVDFTAQHAAVASAAHVRFGRGNHAARLNFGDCVAYATATVANDSLLFVGDDFTHTDVVAALT